MNRVQRITFPECRHWQMDHEIHHESGRFFSITGLRKNRQEILLLRQEEIGILATLYCKAEGGHYFLIQLKEEPGNIPLMQWSPTVQATKSNYERVHKGKPTPYLEYFIDQTDQDVIGSEQGDKFYNKFNRNGVRKTDHKFVPESPLFKWVATKDLKAHLRKDYCINTDLRSVIATSDWGLYSASRASVFLEGNGADSFQQPFHRSFHLVRPGAVEEALSELTRQYSGSDKEWEKLPLGQLSKFTVLPNGIFDAFQHPVIAYFQIALESREVSAWHQPLMCASSMEKCALCFKVEQNIAYFFLNIYAEPGYLGRVEYGPSMQTGTGAHKTKGEDYINVRKKGHSIARIFQTDEGGRFFQIRHQYELLFLDGSTARFFTEKNGIWVSLGELEKLCRQSRVTTNELRTCVSLILSFA